MDILTFLSNNKSILVGAFATISELTVIAINTYRKIKSDQKKFTEGLSFMSIEQRSPIKHLLWAANPLNLFKKI